MKKQKEVIVFVNGIPTGKFCNVCKYLLGTPEKNGWGTCRKTGANVEKIKGKYTKCDICPLFEKEKEIA